MYVWFIHEWAEKQPFYKLSWSSLCEIEYLVVLGVFNNWNGDLYKFPDYIDDPKASLKIL